MPTTLRNRRWGSSVDAALGALAARPASSQITRCRAALLLPAVLTIALPGCGAVGNTRAVKDANALAIGCETSKALEAVDRAARGGGLAANIADLQRVVILRDAGRTAEANAAMAERNARADADAQAAAEAERAVAKSLADLRAERQKQTGRRVCP